MDIQQKALNKIVASINRKRQFGAEVAQHPPEEVKKWMEDQQRERWNAKPVGQAGWKKIATIPLIVDQFFTKAYGENYYKDPDFFEKFPEWKVTKDTRQR